MPAQTSVTRRTLLKLSLTATGSAAATALLAACGDAAATNPPPVAATATRAASPAVTTATPTAATVTSTGSPTVRMTTGATTPTTGMTMGNPAFDSSQKLTIEYWNIFTGMPQIAAINDTIKRFNERYPNVTVQHQGFTNYQEITQKLQAQLAAKSPPAITQAGYDVLNYVANNFPHTTIDELVKRDPQGTAFLKNYAPNVLDLGKVDGVQHGMTYVTGTPFVFYNADLFAQAGIERGPRTWDELRDYARRVREKTGLTGFSMAEAAGFFTSQAVIETNGGRVLVGSGKDVRCGVDSPEAIEAMQFVAEMYTKDKSAVFMDNIQTQNTFSAGQVGMMLGTSNRLATIQGQAKFKLGSASFPTFGTKLRRVPTGGNALFIFAADAPRQAAAWEFIKFLHTPESLTAWTRGTGFIPPRQDLANDPQYLKPYYDENPLMRAEFDQFKDAAPWASWPGKNGLQATLELTMARERIFSGGQDVATVLRDVAKQVNQLVKE